MAEKNNQVSLIIQIPALNEEASIVAAINSLPKTLAGISHIQVVVIDDGSTDNTAMLAEQAGAEVVRLKHHAGLAHAFYTGVRTALSQRADILVNTDADLQYPSNHIAELIAPILAGRADLVIGDRLSARPAAFAPVKQALEHLGSACVSALSGIHVRDAACGFRAFSRQALETLVVHGTFSYTLETLIMAGKNHLAIVNIPIFINPPCRHSRLYKTVPRYIAASGVAILRAYLMYHPLAFFAAIGSVLLCGAFAVGGRFLILSYLLHESGHVQSLILCAILAMLGFQSLVLGFLGDVIAANRRLIEEVRREQFKS